MASLGCWKKACAVILLCAATAIASPAQAFTTLLNFNGNNGARPGYVSLVQGVDGAFYGTTSIGGSRRCAPIGCGGIFRIDSQGALTGTRFEGADGSVPQAGLILGTNGNFYGTTEDGGSGGGCANLEFPGCGTIFEVTSGGKVTTLYAFFCNQTDCPDGVNPIATLIQAADGNFYGTTFTGGAGTNGGGTVFKVTQSGTLTTIYNFCTLPSCADGYLVEGGLVQATDGNFYGTTYYGGTHDYGTVFKITPSGTLTTLHSFHASDGIEPVGTLVQGTDGDLYGTTSSGGDLTCFRHHGCGTVFKITTEGTLTTIYTFHETDGAGPLAALVLATDGNFYGTTSGVVNGRLVTDGTIFKITAAGALTTLHTFSGTDGAIPDGALLQATDGVSMERRTRVGIRRAIRTMVAVPSLTWM